MEFEQISTWHIVWNIICILTDTVTHWKVQIHISRTWQMYCISILIAHFFSLILTLGMYEYHIGFSSLAYKRRVLIKSFSNPSFHVYNSHSHSFYSQNYALKSKNTTKTCFIYPYVLSYSLLKSDNYTQIRISPKQAEELTTTLNVFAEKWKCDDYITTHILAVLESQYYPHQPAWTYAYLWNSRTFSIFSAGRQLYSLTLSFSINPFPFFFLYIPSSCVFNIQRSSLINIVTSRLLEFMQIHNYRAWLKRKYSHSLMQWWC